MAIKIRPWTRAFHPSSGATASDIQFAMQREIDELRLALQERTVFEPLTPGQVAEIFHSMPDGRTGFMKEWGFQQFASRLQDAIRATL